VAEEAAEELDNVLQEDAANFLEEVEPFAEESESPEDSEGGDPVAVSCTMSMDFVG